MSNDKIKVYKNPDRNKTENYKPYVPQYQLRGLDPEEHKSSTLPSNVSGAAPILPLDNSRASRPMIRQPYAEAVASPVGRGKGPVPNVGNNMEHTWSSVDGDIIDDLGNDLPLNPNHPMIDNNDFVSASALGLPPEQLPALDEMQHPASKIFSEPDFQSSLNGSKSDDLYQIIHDLEENSYLLIVSGVAMCSGPLEEIQDQARALIFGEHELCDGNPIPSEDLVILKRTKIKVGVFLE